MMITMEENYTKYEKARIVGARALELAYGAPPLMKVPEGIVDPVKLAEMEFEKGVIPITILRPGSRE
ncbi:RNA polymerase Rpb6 [mine drainage metagenome]|jgi:DNA-directed RNA polymerase subunit K|uniref:RNA polymerase Rpb6 n=1 Tax=mine drainage metagenome TaxID=410659 RepID=T1AU37_9ZZZZ